MSKSYDGLVALVKKSWQKTRSAASWEYQLRKSSMKGKRKTGQVGQDHSCSTPFAVVHKRGLCKAAFEATPGS